jgi:hypothetical protein
MQACITRIHSHASTHRDHGSCIRTLCSVTDHPRHGHRPTAIGAVPLPCRRIFGVATFDEPSECVRAWLDAHVIAEWIGPISMADDYAALLASQFPNLRLTREAALDQAVNR